MLLWVQKIAGGQARMVTLQAPLAEEVLRQVLHAQL